MLLRHTLLVGLLLVAGPVLAQRPTAETAGQAVSFWPLDGLTGTVTFTASTVQPMAPAVAQAEHLRTWLTATCGTSWEEVQTNVAQVHYYRGQLLGVHTGVVLKFAVQVFQRPEGWHYRLFAFEVRSPTGDPDIAHWLPLHRVLADADFQPDVTSFQQQLQRALPNL